MSFWILYTLTKDEDFPPEFFLTDRGVFRHIKYYGLEKPIVKNDVLIVFRTKKYCKIFVKSNVDHSDILHCYR